MTTLTVVDPNLESQLIAGVCRVLVAASRNGGYASAGTTHYFMSKDTGKRSFSFMHDDEMGTWEYLDEFYGGEPFDGVLSVYLNRKRVWALHYMGTVDLNQSPAQVEAILECLQMALRRMPSEFPCRGPEHTSQGAYEYRNTWFGQMDNFNGSEVIRCDKDPVFHCQYIGGLTCIFPLQ